MDRPLGDGNRARGGGRRGRGGRFGGRKRSREEPDPNGSKALLNRIFHLSDRGKGNDAPIDSEVDDMATMLMRDSAMLSMSIEAIIDCAVEISVKTPCYAFLCGLLNSEDQGFGKQLVEKAHADFQSSVQQGDRHRYRMLLRFLAALVLTNVILPSSLLALLSDMVATAKAAAEGNGGGDGRLWQPWADHLVYTVLACLPWAGTELAESGGEALDSLMASVAEYVSMRPKQHSIALMPFSDGSADHEDRCRRSDSGGASFIPRLWAAVQELQANAWVVESLPHLHDAFEARLAQGQPHSLPATTLPTAPPCIDEGMDDITAATAVATAFRPRGTILLLPEGVEGSGEGRPAIERIIIEEYILDILHWFDGDRRETVVRLGNLPVPFSYQAILIETLFGQLLCLPMPPRKPVGYLTIMVDCMKTIEKFSKPLSGCVRELFARMEVLDPELQTRLAEWLAYHLSCFDFQWPWERWAHVLEKPASDGQRRFCMAVLSRILRLSYHEKVVQSVPESFGPLLPPAPVPQPLEVPMVEVPGDVPGAAGGAEEARCVEMLGMVRGKVPAEGMLEWIQEQRLADELGPLGLLGMVLRVLLVAGSKSFTHTLIALERYEDVLRHLLAQETEGAEDCLVSVAAKVWVSSPQRAAIAIDRLMGMRLVQGSTVVRWVFSSRGMKSVDDELAKGLAWEALINCTNKMIARAGDENDDLVAINAELAKALDAAAKAKQGVEDATMADGTVTGRLSMFQEREAEANAHVTEMEQHKAEKLVAVAEADRLRDEHLLDVFKAFADLLHGELLGGDSDSQDRPAWVEAAIASLRAFARCYHVHVAPVASLLLGEVLAEGQVPPLLRSTVMDALQT